MPPVAVQKNRFPAVAALVRNVFLSHPFSFRLTG